MPKTPDYFAGKTIVITGAASGIGRATALIFARERANVVCADIDERGAGETAGEVNRQGSRALAIKVDVTKRTEVDDMAERAVAAFGRIQFLFNSAGAAIRRAKFLEIDDTLMEKTFALNLNGTLYCMQALLPHMLAGKHGVIVNMASMAHRRGGPGSSIISGGQRRGGIDDARRRARIRDARHPRAVDLARADQNAFSGRSAILARADQAIPQRCADAALRRTGGDRRTGSFHLLRRLRIYDCGHGLCERRRRMALIRVWCRWRGNIRPRRRLRRISSMSKGFAVRGIEAASIRQVSAVSEKC